MLQSLRKLSIPGRQLLQNPERGQSLAEMAVIMPILVFIFMGLIEVGWAIRGYLVLLSTGRETTRFAARGEFLDFSGIDEHIGNAYQTVGYNHILRHTDEILSSNGLNLNLDLSIPDNSDGTFIVSHFLIDTGYPCRRVDEEDACETACANGTYYAYDDLILFPGRAGYEHFAYTAGQTRESRLDQLQLAKELVEGNNKLNCQALARTPAAEMSVNSLIVVESFFDQNQVIGVPVISNALTDPIGLYNQTKMRISPVNGLNQGEGCELLPLSISAGDANLPPENPGIDPYPVVRSGMSFEWIRWRGGNSNALGDSISTDSPEYLLAAVNNPRLAINDYLGSGGDTVLNRGDAVLPYTGSISDAEAALDAMEGSTFSIPIYRGAFIIDAFAKLRIIDVDPANSSISGEFLGLEKACHTTDVTDPITVDSLAPILIDDRVIVAEGTNIFVNVLNNDTYATESSLEIVSGPSPGIGDAEVDSGNIHYVAPALGEVTPALPQEVVIVYRACNTNPEPDCRTANLVIEVVADTLPPHAIDDGVIAHVNGPAVPFNVLQNDRYFGGHPPPIAIKSVGTPQVGSVHHTGEGNLEYTPPISYTRSGNEVFNYEVCDATLSYCATGTVNVLINHPPQTQNDFRSMQLGEIALIPVLANDSPGTGPGEAGDRLIIPSVALVNGTGPNYGQATVNGNNGDIIYIPNSGYLGPDSFDYRVCDLRGACSRATVNINVIFFGVLAQHTFDDNQVDGGTGWAGDWTLTPNNGSITLANDTLQLETNGFPGVATRAVDLGQATWSNVQLSFDWQALEYFGGDDTFRVLIEHGSGPSTTEIFTFDGDANSGQTENIQLLNAPHTIDQTGTITLIFQTNMAGSGDHTILVDNLVITVTQ